jgi:outer membrane protein assembly factor BamA
MPGRRTLVFAVLLALTLTGLARAGDTSVTPFPFIFYTPETGLAGGGTVLIYVRGEDPEARPSVISPIFIYTAKKQTLSYLSGEVYLDDERWRLGAMGGYTKFPNTFWGVGNDAPDSDEEDYTPRTSTGSLSVERLVASALYVGGRLDYGKRTLLEVETGGLLDTAAVPGTLDGHVMTAGVSLSRDTRDSTTYPRAGGMYNLLFAVTGGGLGGDYDYRTLNLNFTSYRQLAERSVLALQLVAEARSDTPPFDLLPQLGGDMLLRGYYGGRWRDRNMMACQAEWRGPLWRSLSQVVFVGAGQVGRDLGDLDLGGLHVAGGWGLRFPLNKAEQLNLRMDWGFGSDSSGFYMSLGEAF